MSAHVAGVADHLSGREISYTLSDADAASLLAPGPAGVLSSGFGADSSQWDAGTLPCGGSAHPRDPEHSYFAVDGGLSPTEPTAAASRAPRPSTAPRPPAYPVTFHKDTA